MFYMINTHTFPPISMVLTGALSSLQNQIVFVSILFFGATFAAIALTLVGIFFLACGKYTNCTGTFIGTITLFSHLWMLQLQCLQITQTTCILIYSLFEYHCNLLQMNWTM